MLSLRFANAGALKRVSFRITFCPSNDCSLTFCIRREITRLALQARDAKISELQHRVNTLEAELETEKAIVKHLRWEKSAERDL